MDNREDRILGCLLGLASGDAFGMPTEFMTREEIKTQYGWVDRFLAPHEGHIHDGMLAGRVTDDTGQALALAQAAVQDGGHLSPETTARALLHWMDSLGEEYEKVVGPSTRRALELLRQGISPEEAGWEGRTNGAAMRAPIAGLLHPGNIQAALNTACFSSLPTHGTNIALAGAGAVACAVAQAQVPDTSLESVLLAAQEGAAFGAKLGHIIWGTSLENRIVLALSLVERAPNEEEALETLFNYVGVDLLVAESVAAAFGIVKLAEGEPVQAITLSANLGGDTDTIGAIAGAVCGAWKGVTAFPPAWLNILEQVNHFDLTLQAKQLAAVTGNP